MVTSFGKFLRNLRMDLGELLLHMAKKLDVSPAFLSSVENGKRKIPESWPGRIASLYNLSKNQVAELRASFYDSNKTVEIDLNRLQENKKHVAIAFARKLEEISDSDVDRLLRVLGGKAK